MIFVPLSYIYYTIQTNFIFINENHQQFTSTNLFINLLIIHSAAIPFLIYNLLQMTEQIQAKGTPFEPQSRQGTLIESLRQQPNFLMQQYNQKLKKENEEKGIKKAGGIYIPPHKLRALQEQMMQADPSSEAHQRMMWELLRKSINGIVNKVNIANIQNVVIELFNENIMRGRGLLARALIKAQMASPNFTHVYAALIAVINTKVPQIGLLVAKRVLIQFRRSFQRNNKIVCVATTRMIAHLVNQRILGQYIALQILLILLNSPTEDSVQIACDFMIQVGQVLSQITPAGATAIFQRFKSLLHEAEIEQKAQYSIQNLFAIRKTGFKQHAGVIPDLDLVQPEDQITHQLDLEEDDMKGDQNLNMFKLDPKYEETEAQWDAIKQEILGEQNLTRLKEPDAYEEQHDQAPAQQGIQDLTQQDLVNLRKTIYLAIQSTVNFQECAHKIIKMNIAKGYEHQLVDMILQCSMMERIYQTFFGLLAERFCIYDNKFKELFERAFLKHYNNIFNQEANKIRNLALLFGHLFHRKAIDWSILQPIRLTPDSTTAAARMFLKILLKDIAQNLGIGNLVKEFQKQQMKEYYQGLFPIQNMNDLRFAINYYTTIGLGQLTEEMREVLSLHEQIINERRRKQEEAQAKMLIQEEEEMMRLAMEEQKIKDEEQKKIKMERKGRDQRQREQRREREEERQREKRNERRGQKRQRDEWRGDKKERNRHRQSNSSEREQDRDKRKQRQRSRSRSRHSSQDERQKRKDKERDREREKQNERRQRQKQRQKERELQKQKQREREREREKEKEREREKEKEKEKEREREKQRQREKQKQIEKKEQRQKEQKQKQKQRQLQKAKQAQIEKRQRQVRQKQKNKERNRSRSRDNRNAKKRNDRRRRRSSSSVNRSSSQKQNRRKKISQNKHSSKKVAQRRRESSSDSSSSGLSSSSSSSSSKQKVQKVNVRQAKVKSSSSESEISSSSESSGQASSSSNVKIKRVQSSSS